MKMCLPDSFNFRSHKIYNASNRHGYMIKMTNIIKLPDQQTDSNFPLMKALAIRRSIRKWKKVPLSSQEISNLLWAWCGITQKQTNRIKSKRTAPSACNSQEIKIYIALKNGIFRYDENNHNLMLISSKDIRKHIGTQKMMHSAPVGLYVADYSKLSSFLFTNDDRRWFISCTDAGFISQNIYLYCDAAGLSTVIISFVDRNKLHNLVGLKECERVVYSQVVGKSIDI